MYIFIHSIEIKIHLTKCWTCTKNGMYLCILCTTVYWMINLEQRSWKALCKENKTLTRRLRRPEGNSNCVGRTDWQLSDYTVAKLFKPRVFSSFITEEFFTFFHWLLFLICVDVACYGFVSVTSDSKPLSLMCNCSHNFLKFFKEICIIYSWK